MIACTVCAYAEYWGCLEVIGPRILSILRSAPGFWHAVSLVSLHYLAFAVKLKADDFYFRALRFSIFNARKDGRDWDRIADLTGWREQSLRSFYKPEIAQLDFKVDRKLEMLEKELRKLQLRKTRVERYNERPPHLHDARTRYMDIASTTAQDLSERTKADEQAEYLAQAIYGEHISYRLQGDEVYKTDLRICTDPAGYEVPQTLSLPTSHENTNV